MNWLNNVKINSLNKSLDGLWLRQNTISDNIANFETPGYKKKTVSFEDQLKSELFEINQSKKQTISNINNISPMINISNDQSKRPDGNNVDIEFENIEMARTQINYMFSTSQLNECFTRLRTSINGVR